MRTQSRRAFLRNCGRGAFAAALFGLPGCAGLAKTRAKTKKPNIIFILADDLGYGDLSCYGQKKFRTPNIDRLAAEGILFTDHYSGSTVCAPSRCSLMVGRHTGHALVRGNYEIGPGGFGAELPLRPEDTTVAEVLKKAGYKTAVLGKWGMGIDNTTGRPNKKGFDYFFGFLNQAHAHYYYPEYLWRNRDKIELPENKNGRRGLYSHDLFIDETLRFMERSKDGPFFIYCALTIPHAELLVPEDSLKPFKGKFPETPYIKSNAGGSPEDGFGAYASQDYPKAAFAGMVTRLDRDLGTIMRKLKQLGIDEDTLVIFTSDNGPHKEGGADPVFFNSSGPLKGTKRDLYEGGIRVPFIARWPGKIEPASVSNHPSAFWDFLPTAAEIANVEPAENIDGINPVRHGVCFEII